jgi:hypothetical protein
MFAFVGVVIALVLGATSPGRYPRPRVQRAGSDVTEDAPAETLLGVFFWMLLFVLMSALIARVFWA